MNNLSNAALRDNSNHFCSFRPLPTPALYILLPLFLLGLAVSVFFLIVVQNAAFVISFLLLFSLVFAFIGWNTHNWRKKGAILLFFRSFPDSDIRRAKEGQLVKITGRFSTDFYITDQKSGTQVVVKAGSGSKVIPLIAESQIIHTSGQHRILSPHLRKWLKDRNLSTEARILRLEEGYVQEGSSVTVIGMLHRNDDIAMVLEPPGVISTGCMWHKLLLPVDIDGLIIGISQMAVPVTTQESGQPIAQ
ncbi:uncharacterized membrane protein At1g16860-like isoform X2 [Neltuma alba]|uniref:uncharacterized membrane protein At1g16860-like isoform X2 n=1 Tax=Neltuma alba TaxID=207710 RepID=UPI0010A34A19|nr:uncharacterized membrane protein At1g16860-like isoform X2 [Prosopis alba]